MQVVLAALLDEPRRFPALSDGRTLCVARLSDRPLDDGLRDVITNASIVSLPRIVLPYSEHTDSIPHLGSVCRGTFSHFSCEILPYSCFQILTSRPAMRVTIYRHAKALK